VRRADRERTAPIAFLLFGQPLDALDFFQDLERAIDDPFTGRRHLRQGATLT
jgi:hypothetical protein